MQETSFLNIDLDIESKEDLTPLMKCWKDEIVIFRLEKENGIWYCSIETSEVSESDIINKYYQLVSNLNSDLKNIWYRALKRNFDFGYERNITQKSFQTNISQEYVSKINEMHGSITITTYLSN